MEVGERNGVGVPKEAQSKETHSKGTQSYGSSVYSAKLDWDFLKQGRLFERKNERKMLIRGFQRRLQPNSKPEPKSRISSFFYNFINLKSFLKK